MLRILYVLAGLCLMALSLPAMAVSPLPGTLIHNQASARFADTNGAPLSVLSGNVTTEIGAQARVMLTKLSSSDPVAPGGTLVYTLEVQNSGNLTARNVLLSDSLDPLLTLLDASPVGSLDGNNLSWSLGDLAPGELRRIILTTQVDSAASDGSLINNQARVIWDGGQDERLVQNRVGRASNLAVALYGPTGPVHPDGELHFEIDYSNRGNLTATRVELSVTLADAVRLLDDTPPAGATLSGRQLHWLLEDLPAGSSGRRTFDLRVSPLAIDGQQIQHIAVLTSFESNPIASLPVTNQVRVSSDGPSLAFSKLDDPDPVRIGNPLNYTLELRNTGVTALTDVAVSDPLPTGTRFITADQGAVLGSDGVVRWTLSRIEPGTLQRLHLRVQLDPSIVPGAIIRNQAMALVQQVQFPSPLASTTVAARTDGTLRFIDASGNQRLRYSSTERIYLEVNDPDRDEDPSALDTLLINLAHPTSGDHESLLLTETAPASGLFRGDLASRLDNSTVEDGVISVSPDSWVTASYQDPRDETPTLNASALIDPQGVVFDTVTGLPVAGATVTLFWDSGTGRLPAASHPDWPTASNDQQVTTADGHYQFVLVPEGDFSIVVTPPAPYSFPTRLGDADLPSGQLILTGSRGESFNRLVNDPSPYFDLPLDPPAGKLDLTLTADQTHVETGDFVQLTLRLRNPGASAVNALRIDQQLASGLVYLPGSSRINGISVPDPSQKSSNSLTWNSPALPAQETLDILFTLRVSAAVRNGETTLSAHANGSSVGLNLTARAQIKLEVSKGVFEDRALLFGKVFIDRDGDGQQSDSLAATVVEPGVPQAILYLEDGTRIETDAQGLYSVRNVLPGTHVLRLDESLLPSGLHPALAENRALGRHNSLLVDVLAGLPSKANIPVAADPAELPALLRHWYVIQLGSPLTLPQAQSLLKTLPWTGGWVTSSGLGYQVLIEAGPTDGDPYALLQRVHQQGYPQASILARPESRDARWQPPTPQKNASTETSVSSLLTLLPAGASPNKVHILSPREGTVIRGDHVDIDVLAPLNGTLGLTVNGITVAAEQQGSETRDPNAALALYRFENITLPSGVVSLRAFLQDASGSIGTPDGSRSTDASVSVRVPGQANRLLFTTTEQPLIADGQRTVEVDIAVLDQRAIVLQTPRHLTINIEGATPLDADLDPNAEGHQVAYLNGAARLRMQAPASAGPVDIEAHYAAISAHTQLHFLPNLRDPLLVGFGEVGVGSAAGARGGVFYQGRVADDMLLTTRYNRAGNNSDLFRSGEQDIADKHSYPLLGDDSQIDYGAASQSEIYLRLDRNRDSLLYGDYNTELEQNSLTRYRQALTGLRFDLHRPQGDLRLFAAETQQSHFSQAFQGRGLSGFYTLEHSPLTPGSETVEIEVQDRFQPGRILERRTLTRFRDYEIDYNDGTILFNEPIASVDLGFNPQFIRVNYSAESSAQERVTFGGQFNYLYSDAITLGTSALINGQENNDSSLFGLNSHIQLGPNHQLTAEWAYSEDKLSGIDTLDQQGQAWLTELSGTLRPGATYNLQVKTADADFNNPAASGVISASKEASFDISQDLGDDRKLSASLYQAVDTAHDATSQSSRIAYSGRFDPHTEYGVAVSDETIDADFLQPDPDQAATALFTPALNMPSHVTALTLSGNTQITPRLDLRAMHKQGIAGDSYQLSQLGADYRLTDRIRLYLRQEFASVEEDDEQRSVLGAEAALNPSTTLFNEYRLDEGQEGASNQQVYGMRNRFNLGDKLSLNLTLENAHTLSGGRRTTNPDAFAASARMKLQTSRETAFSSRIEHRQETGTSPVASWLLEGSASHRYPNGMSLLIQERLLRETNAENQQRRRSRLLLGLSHRPTDNDRLNLFSRLSWLHESNPAMGLDKDAYIFSGEGVYQTSTTLALTGKYAGKQVEQGPYSGYSDLYGLGARYRITPTLDLGFGYRLFSDHNLDTRSHSGTVELGYRLLDRIWLGAGYASQALDPDLAGSLSGKGVFLRLRVKFDETDLKPWL